MNKFSRRPHWSSVDVRWPTLIPIDRVWWRARAVLSGSVPLRASDSTAVPVSMPNQSHWKKSTAGSCVAGADDPGLSKPGRHYAATLKDIQRSRQPERRPRTQPDPLPMRGRRWLALVKSHLICPMDPRPLFNQPHSATARRYTRCTCAPVVVVNRWSIHRLIAHPFCRRVVAAGKPPAALIPP